MTLATRCDGCGRPFEANAWNQRTCVACECKQFPDQSKLDWDSYQKALRDYLREHQPDNHKPLHGDAARRRASVPILPGGGRADLRRRTVRVGKKKVK
jgi:hypothetical protein